VSEAEPVDLLVVGGGINGAAVARDAAGRGLKVVLCEQGDLANNPSSACRELSHGGLSRLERHAGREALLEREILQRSAPQVVRPLRAVLPQSPAQRSATMIRVRPFLSGRLWRGKERPGVKRINLRRDPAGAPLQPVFRRGLAYPDWWVDDARLVILNALDAHERGAEIRTRTRCTAARRANGLWYAHLTPASGAPVRLVRARALINAAGPWASRFCAERAGLATPSQVRLVKGSHIVVPRLYEHDDAYVLRHPDGRAVFVIPYEGRFSLICATEVDHHGDPAEVRTAGPETLYLCDAVSRYFREAPRPDQVAWTFAGVRPLYHDAGYSPSTATPDYVFDLDRVAGEAPLLSIFGGRTTSCRKLAERVIEKLQPLLGFAREPWTAGAPLPGGDMPDADFEGFARGLQRAARWLPSDLARRYARAYGSRAGKFLLGARQLSDLGERLGEGLYEAEVDYLRRHEWAMTAEDILWRRSKLGLQVSAATVARLEAMFDRGIQAPPAAVAAQS
jgi:glycerol-3-phosphate dehydrogenase